MMKNLPGLDEIDVAILKILQADGRLSNLDLARRINLSPPATHARVRRLEREGYIRGYVALVDRELVGYDLLCFIMVSIQFHQTQHTAPFLEKVRNFPEVLECHHITGEFDYLLKVMVHDHRELERFVSQKLTPLPGIARLQTSIVFNEIKATTALPLEE
jgi:DNA-binding Lrp family transcriptional regulator